MRGMMQEKPWDSIRHMQAAGRAVLKLGTKPIAWAARPRTRAHSGESTAPGKRCCQRRNHRHGKPLGEKICLAQKSSYARRYVLGKKKKKLHNAPNTSIQELGIFIMTGKIWKYQNKRVMGVIDRSGKIVNAAKMAMTMESAYDFQRGCASLISKQSPPME